MNYNLGAQNFAMSELDPNILTAELISRCIEAFVNNTLEKPTTALRRTWHTLANAYSPYLEQTYQRVSTIKTFLKTNEPINILDAYVPLSAKFGNSISSDLDIIESFKAGNKILVTATAGRGKSMLLRYIATCMFEAGNGVIPLFLELRALNHLTNKEILTFIHSTYRGTSNVNYKDFENALRKGKFSLVLDGFDEVDHDSRREVEAKILDLSNNFPDTSIIISSRPDSQRFGSWEKFHHYNMCPMDLDQVRQLILKGTSKNRSSLSG